MQKLETLYPVIYRSTKVSGTGIIAESRRLNLEGVYDKQFEYSGGNQ